MNTVFTFKLLSNKKNYIKNPMMMVFGFNQNVRVNIEYIIEILLQVPNHRRA